MAVVSQPCDRHCKLAAPGRIDRELKEFWVESPWEIIARGHNLSAYERKRAYLNVGGQTFLEISHLTGADNDGDGRSVVAADFGNTGRLDLIVRQVSGGPLLLYENRFPQRHYLKVSLRGRPSNRSGVGARLTAVVRGRRLVREMYPSNTYRSQAPNLVHFGLGDAEVVERLVIRWPSGRVQELRGLKADRHIVVDEGKEGARAVQTVVLGQTILP
jgi:enediyne biosynthesis protein E4